MSTHIGAEAGDIAPRVLLPGDPLRATWIADTFLEGARRYSSVRAMNGYTGTYRGEPVSVQGTGMGMPSASIYVNELIRDLRLPAARAGRLLAAPCRTGSRSATSCWPSVRRPTRP
ncbi:MAG: hypothetical protein WKF76_10165 [Nocardioidaceae bacterium]